MLLGIVDNGAIDFRPIRFGWACGRDCQLLLYSNGLIEAESADGVAFGRERRLATTAARAGMHCRTPCLRTWMRTRRRTTFRCC